MRRLTCLLLLCAPLLALRCEGPDGGEPVDPMGMCPAAWRSYPHQPVGTEIVFPDDEGSHYVDKPEVTMEWWYTIYHLVTPEGREFSIMATFFMPQLDVAFRPFNITDLESGEMWDSSVWGDLFAEEGRLDTTWVSDTPGVPPSSLRTRTDGDGKLIPFSYDHNLSYQHPTDPARTQGLSLQLDSVKSPYIVSGDGYVDIGDSGESWYYSLTHLEVSGELELNGETFQVSGFGWMDHQWGPFMLYPLGFSPTSYEWMALHLDNGDEYMVSNLFDRDNRLHATEGFGSVGWKLADCSQGISLDYTIERLAFWKHAASGRYYSHRWRIVVPETGLDVILEPAIEDQTVAFFTSQFYEGRSNISGTVNGEPVGGLAFAELVHHYELPRLVMASPSADATVTTGASLEVVWALQNPDDGLALGYEVTLTDDTSTVSLCSATTGEDRCTGTVSGVTGSATLRVRGSSVDGVVSSDASVLVSVLP